MVMNFPTKWISSPIKMSGTKTCIPCLFQTKMIVMMGRPKGTSKIM